MDESIMSESQILDALQRIAKRVRVLETRGIAIGDAPSDGTEYVRKNGGWITNTGGAGYVLPTASAATLGGVKIGARITIVAGVISADLQGDVTGPAGATDGDIAVYNLATGKLIKDSGVNISSLPSKCNSADINTGTDDAKFATSLAIAGSNIVFTDKSQVLTAKQIGLIDGWAGSPSIYFDNDGNTGFYRQGSDLLTFCANGQNCLNVSGTSGAGRLMVGNGDPISRFQINADDNTADTGITLGGNSGTYVQIYKSASNTLTITSDITLSDTRNLIFNTTTGTKIGTATSQKLSFWNASPIVQPVGATQVAPAAYSTGAYGLDSNAHMQALYDLIVAMRTVLVNTGLMKGAA
jgi:hypothetical protein